MTLYSRGRDRAGYVRERKHAVTPSSRLKTLTRSARFGSSATMRWWDLAVLTAIFFGPAIMTSISVSSRADDIVAPSVPEFTSTANWWALIQQAFLLAVGVAYLCGRRIRLSRWSVRPTWKGAVLGVGLFAFIGIVFDLAYTLYGRLADQTDVPAEAPAESVPASPAGRDISLLAYSAFNALYEEFFFLVVCMSLPDRFRAQALAYSLGVRATIHTYQGLFNAMMIGVVSGAIFYFASRRLTQRVDIDGVWLFPFLIAHALADYLGVGLLGLFLPADASGK